MALTQKEVIYALLRNHNSQAKALCVKADVSYKMFAKRISNGTVHTMNLVDEKRLCVALDVPAEEFRELMSKAANGDFADDYPLEEIKLTVIGTPFVDDRTIFEMLTPGEYEVIKAMRASEKKSFEAMVRITSKDDTGGSK